MKMKKMIHVPGKGTILLVALDEGEAAPVVGKSFDFDGVAIYVKGIERVDGRGQIGLLVDVPAFNKKGRRGLIERILG